MLNSTVKKQKLIIIQNNIKRFGKIKEKKGIKEINFKKQITESFDNKIE